MRCVFYRRSTGERQGFTLIEMLVVIGMVTIVTAVALPSLRGLFQEFKINQTIEEADTLISSYRSHYLIMNEFPVDTHYDTLKDTKADWCFPRNFYTTSPHKFSITPYKGTQFDFELWAVSTSASDIASMKTQDAILINMRGLSDPAVTEKYKAKLSNLYPKISLPMNGTSILGIVFPEFTKEYCDVEVLAHRNRYH